MQISSFFSELKNLHDLSKIEKINDSVKNRGFFKSVENRQI